jgi:hypothetical protein
MRQGSSLDGIVDPFILDVLHDREIFSQLSEEFRTRRIRVLDCDPVGVGFQ